MLRSLLRLDYPSGRSRPSFAAIRSSRNADDLLDPVELLRITPLKLFPSLGGFGIENVDLTSQAERSVCVDSGNPDVTTLFTDGQEHFLEIAMESGSVQIASLVVTITGTNAWRPLVPGSNPGGPTSEKAAQAFVRAPVDLDNRCSR